MTETQALYVRLPKRLTTIIRETAADSGLTLAATVNILITEALHERDLKAADRAATTHPRSPRQRRTA